MKNRISYLLIALILIPLSAAIFLSCGKDDGGNGKKDFLEFSPNEIGVSSEGQSFSVTLNTNVLKNLEITSANEWIDVTIDKNTSTLVITVPAYDGEYARTGTVTLGVIDKNLEASLKVVQEGGNGFCPDGKHPHAIDLGIGVKWACCNVGATSPEEFGGYYSWGEVEEKTNYDTTEYLYMDDEGYINIGDDIAGTEYDVAHVLWKKTWTMPSVNQFKDLCNQCQSEWTTYKDVNGRRFTGPNGESIFIPAAGYYYKERSYDVGNFAYLSSSTQDLNNIKYSYRLKFDKSETNVGSNYRSYGRTVRPVTE